MSDWIPELLRNTAHRPWALPTRAWVMTNTWSELLFAHWPVPPEVLRPLIPKEVELDTYQGQAWVAVVPFQMSRVRLRWVPPIPTTTAFPELNLRTYVRYKEKSGVHFFSLEASSWLVVRAARLWYGLPYFDARMFRETNNQTGNAERIKYQSLRTMRKAAPAEFKATYRPLSPVFRAESGTLEHWLTERYALFTVDQKGRVRCGEIHHQPWPLQKAAAQFEVNTLAAASGVPLPEVSPHLLYAKKMDVLIWAPRRVD